MSQKLDVSHENKPKIRKKPSGKRAVIPRHVATEVGHSDDLECDL